MAYKGYIKWAILISFLLACKRNPLSPGLEYMPDMYRHNSIRAYEPVGDTSSIRHLPEGVVPLGEYIYPLPPTPEGYEKASAIKNPVPLSDSVLELGKFYYSKFCLPCHGPEGKGDGPVVTKGGFPPPPSYLSPNLLSLPEGKMFHSITYGKNLMPPHSYQLSPIERWMVVHYIKHVLQDTSRKGA